MPSVLANDAPASLSLNLDCITEYVMPAAQDFAVE
jgi:hypothetical protein